MEEAARARPTGLRGFAALQPLLLLLLLVPLAAREGAGLKLHAPPGASDGQLVLTEGDTLALWCEDSDDVRLLPPPFPAPEQGQEPVLPEIVHRRTGHLWNATLLLRSARPAHSGYYNCSSVPNRLDEDSLYVYVRSSVKDRPWVLDSDEMRQKKMIPQYSAHIHKTATLDCRPNDPTTSVRLRDSKNRTMSLGRQPDGAELSWNPRVGFRLGPVETRHSGAYWCHADGSNRDLQVHLQAVSPELAPPMVWLERSESPTSSPSPSPSPSPPPPPPPSSSTSVARGASVSLICELATARRVDFNLTWTTPTGRVNEGYRWVAYGAPEDPSAWHRRTKMLYLFAVKDADAGDYTCSADDGKGNRRSSVLRLEVQGAPTRDLPKPLPPSVATVHETQGPNAHKGHKHPAPSSSTKVSAGAALLVSAAFCVLLAPAIGKLPCCCR